MQNNLLALTPCCVDYYPQINKSFIGGNSLNVASMWHRIDPSLNISVISCLGNDDNGKKIIDYLSEIGIDYSRVYIKEGKTATNKLIVDENGERFGIEGAWEGGVYETFLLSDDDWKWVAQQEIVAMPGNNPNFQTMINKKHKNQLLSVDYLDIENNIPFNDTFEFTDIAFIAARPSLLPKYQKLAFAKNKLVVVTLGVEGSHAYKNGETYFQPALPVANVIDTTGCGDAYQAAFALMYYRSNDIQKSMFAGAKAASEILQYWGGVGKF
ncbi:PfkB family carbohydrate kinase [Bacteroidota bacterium]